MMSDFLVGEMQLCYDSLTVDIISSKFSGPDSKAQRAARGPPDRSLRTPGLSSSLKHAEVAEVKRERLWTERSQDVVSRSPSEPGVKAQREQRGSAVTWSHRQCGRFISEYFKCVSD